MTSIEVIIENEEDDFEEIKIDRIEAKTLDLCVQTIKSLLQEDIQAFVDFPLEERVKIFMSLTRILDLSFSLYPQFYQRDLKNYKDDWDNRSGSNNTYTFGKTGISSSRPSRRHSQHKKSKFRKRRVR